MEIKENVPLANYTSWLIGGPAEYFAAPENIDELKEALIWANQKSQKITVLGGGTNVLIGDSGVPGLVICMRKMSGIEVREEGSVLRFSALSGTPKSLLLKTFLKHKLPPALFLAGLPGDVGGGVAMNAGVGESYEPREFVSITDWIEVIDPVVLEIKKYQRDELQWSYRKCLGWQPGIITKVGFSWPMQPDVDVLKRVKEVNKRRLTKQPLESPSCGSVFRNPEGGKSGQLIESCGLKGHQIGGAQISEKHANFIINTGDASSQDVADLISLIQRTVKDKKGYSLQTEVVFMGSH